MLREENSVLKQPSCNYGTLLVQKDVCVRGLFGNNDFRRISPDLFIPKYYHCPDNIALVCTALCIRGYETVGILFAAKLGRLCVEYEKCGVFNLLTRSVPSVPSSLSISRGTQVRYGSVYMRNARAWIHKSRWIDPIL